VENDASQESDPGQTSAGGDDDVALRRHHYSFAHIHIRNAFFVTPDAFLKEMRSPIAEESLRLVWDYSGYMALDINMGPRLPPDGLSVSIHEMYGSNFPIITLPVPEGTTEAFFVAALPPIGASREYRYFTLERAYDSTPQVQIGIFCEWFASGTHLTYDVSRRATIANFCRAIEEQLSVYIQPEL